MSASRHQGLNLISKLNNIHVEDLQYVEQDLCYYELVSAAGTVNCRYNKGISCVNIYMCMHM